MNQRAFKCRVDALDGSFNNLLLPAVECARGFYGAPLVPVQQQDAANKQSDAYQHSDEAVCQPREIAL